MNVKRLYAGLTGLVLAGGLAACGSAAAPAAVPRAAVTVTATPIPTVTPTPTPTVTKTKTVVVPPRTVYVPAAPAAPALTACGTGVDGEEVYAGPSTSCSFALNVEQIYVQGGYWYQAGTSQFYAYSPVTGSTYLMTSSSVGNPVVVTGGNGASVQFSIP